MRKLLEKARLVERVRENFTEGEENLAISRKAGRLGPEDSGLGDGGRDGGDGDLGLHTCRWCMTSDTCKTHSDRFSRETEASTMATE